MIESGDDLYAALAPIYDDWQASDGMTPFALVTADKLTPLLEREAQRPTRETLTAEGIGDPFSFLDLGCGTGTLLGALRARHPSWRLAGVDASGAMLAVAARRPDGRTIEFARAALDHRLPFPRTFDAVGAFYDTFNHLPDTSALARAFAAISEVIRPGGLLAFDLTNRRGFERWWRGRNDFRGDGWRISVDARFEATTETGRAEVAIARDGPVRTYQLLERHLPEPEVRRALSAAGFEVQRTEGWAPFAYDLEGKTWWLARHTAKSHNSIKIDTIF